MPTVSRTFSVSPPPRQVIEYRKDFGYAVEWDPGTQKCTRIDSGPIGEGASWHNVSKIFGATTGSVITYRNELEMHGLLKLFDPVLKLAFEKLASDTEKQLTSALNRLPIKEKK